MACTAMITGIKLVASSKKGRQPIILTSASIGANKDSRHWNAIAHPEWRSENFLVENDDRHPVYLHLALRAAHALALVERKRKGGGANRASSSVFRPEILVSARGPDGDAHCRCAIGWRRRMGGATFSTVCRTTDGLTESRARRSEGTQHAWRGQIRQESRLTRPRPRISPTPTSILRRDNALPLVLNFRSFNFLQKYVCKHNFSKLL